MTGASRMRLPLTLAFAVFALASPATAPNPSYVFTRIDNPAADTANGERTHAFGINDADDIVGEFGRHGFVYSDGAFVTIDVPGASRTSAFGINNARQIVGNFTDSTGTHAFIL